jgi:sigma-B regulation protein RsbU (phosphoserine phosphatase)
VYGLLDCSNGELRFARAGHPSPYLLDAVSHPMQVSVAFSQALGLFEDPPIDEGCLHLPPGGTLLLYSDGVTETMDASGAEFGLDSLQRTLAANRLRPAQEICTQLWQDVQAHGKDLPQQDDFTSVVVKRSLEG